MSFEPRDYLKHSVAEADYLLGRSADLTFEVWCWNALRSRLDSGSKIGGVTMPTASTITEVGSAHVSG